MIISLLDFWRQLGVAVDANDEGEYWETRSEETLCARLKAYDGLIAAVAGVFKDATDTSGKGYSVASPIFARNDFERLEAAGGREFGNRVSQLAGVRPRETR
jgi:hypothetical protein